MTTLSRIPNPGDVVMLQVGFLDRTGAKTRPALVLSPYRFNQARGYFIFTSLTGSAGSFSEVPPAEVMDISEAGLNRRSYIHGILETANNYEIRRIIGRLSTRDRTGVRPFLTNVIAL